MIDRRLSRVVTRVLRVDPGYGASLAHGEAAAEGPLDAPGLRHISLDLGQFLVVVFPKAGGVFESPGCCLLPGQLVLGGV